MRSNNEDSEEKEAQEVQVNKAGEKGLEVPQALRN